MKSLPNPAEMLPALVPFVRTLGIRIDTVTTPGQAVAHLEYSESVGNHIGTLHAGALYTLAETASGAAMLSIFGDVVAGGAFVALKAAQVAHLKARPGTVTASATVDADAAGLRKTYESTGKLDADVAVSLSVGDTEVATVQFTWAVRAPRG